jgi:ABC-type antimicrobial peptide transport system permease subunit
VDQPAPSTVYWPLRGTRGVAVVIRGARTGTEAYAAEIRRTVASISRGLSIAQLQTMTEIYDRSMARTAFTLTLLAISGGMALLLAAVGIYAVISYTVSQRVREIGIRLALGADPGDVLRLVLGRAALLAGVGVAAGIAGAAGLTRLIAGMLFGVTPTDPIAFMAVPLVTLAAVLLASYVPARRAMRVSPVTAMTAE